MQQTTAADKKNINQLKARRLRQLLSEGGEQAVKKRYGEQELASKEYREAKRQEAERRRQASEARREAHRQSKPATKQASKPATKTPAADRTGKPSTRARFQAARKEQAQRERDAARTR